MSSPHLAVIGGGPAGLMAAETAAMAGARVTVFDRMRQPGRKFLLAGRGGLNLTHAEPFAVFATRYGAAREKLLPALQLFPPEAMVAWCEGLGQPTFVGSSMRVFPVAMKASPLLRAWRGRLDRAGVVFAPGHRWISFGDDGAPNFATDTGAIRAEADATVLALGGASWPRLGSDGAWPALLGDVAVTPLRPANGGLRIAWSDTLRGKFAGTPLKRIALQFDGRVVRGEAVLTEDGIEGGVVYAVFAAVRDALAHRAVTLLLDLRPDLDAAALAARLAGRRGGQSMSTFLRKTTGLSPVAVALVQEALHRGPAARNRAAHDLAAQEMAALIKAVPLPIAGLAPIERAISTAGGVAWSEIDDAYMLRRLPGVFVAGEMLDWEAPTGGYLLQACMATGAAAGHGALAWLTARPGADRFPSTPATAGSVLP